MVDPEIAYQRLTSGDAAALRAEAAALTAAAGFITESAGGLDEAAGLPEWSASGASAFLARTDSVRQGLEVGSVVVDLAGGGLEAAATAYDAACRSADRCIGFWRNRPPDLPPMFEALLARAVQEGLESTARGYDQQLAGIATVMTGGDQLDLDALDEDTREWVEDGLDRTENWNDLNDSSNGPLIPNTKATGDDRNLTPQGLGYDPSGGGTFFQAYNDEDSGDRSGLALIDERTGTEVDEVQLGGLPDRSGTGGEVVPGPDHVGGVTVDEENQQVIVTSEDRIYTYPMGQVRGQEPGGTATPSDVSSTRGGSYAAMHGGQLYVGDFYDDTMRVYDRDPDGGWTPATDPDTGEEIVIETPSNVQGVVVRDGEFVYSRSSGRGATSTVTVTDREGNDISHTLFPNMSQGIVETRDGDIVTTYESGAARFDHYDSIWQRLGGPLWASPYMTSTPVEVLLEEDHLLIVPPTLVSAAGVLGDPAAGMRKVAGVLDDVHVPASAFGEVPTAARLARVVDVVARGSSRSARTSATAVDHLADSLVGVARDHEGTDGAVSSAFGRLDPW